MSNIILKIYNSIILGEVVSFYYIFLKLVNRKIRIQVKGLDRYEITNYNASTIRCQNILRKC